MPKYIWDEGNGNLRAQDCDGARIVKGDVVRHGDEQVRARVLRILVKMSANAGRPSMRRYLVVQDLEGGGKRSRVPANQTLRVES